MGKKRLQSQTDALRKRPLKPGLTHREKNGRVSIFTHVLEQKELLLFFSNSSTRCWRKVKPEFIHSLKFQKDIPNERNALNHTDNSPCQKLAKIKAFQSAFEVKDSAANGTCRQVNFLTYIDAIYTLWFVKKAVSALSMHTPDMYLKNLIFVVHM